MSYINEAEEAGMAMRRQFGSGAGAKKLNGTGRSHARSRKPCPAVTKPDMLRTRGLPHAFPRKKRCFP